MTKEKALALLDEAYEKNPGLWKEHSITAGKIAYTIASHIKGVDAEKCEMYALLHDIGRIRGKHKIRHTLDGYRYLCGLGEEECARYCITHVFPGNRIIEHTSFDISSSDLDFLQSFVMQHPNTIEDKIVQLSDVMASPYGPMVVEVRLIESGIRNASNINVFETWQEYLKVKDEINRILGKSVYKLFKNIICEWTR